MDEIAHPLMSAHVPSFITRPAETDTLLVVVGVFLICLIIGVGILYFRLHALPEQMAHRGNSKAQFEIVAVLALLALFTHNNAFWVAALLLAMIPLSDFLTPLKTMAVALGDVARSLWSRSTAETGAVPEPMPEPALIPEPVQMQPSRQVKA